MKPYKNKKGSQVYGCGHTHNGMIFINLNELVMASYFVWKETTGFDGDKSQCFDCYLKEGKNEN